MSFTKQLVFGTDPELEPARREIARRNWDYISKFKFRVPLRRLVNESGSRSWDPLWPMSVTKATKQLGFESVRVNDGLLFRTKAQRAAVLKTAEELYPTILKTWGR